jgi:hypothetical protein
MGLKKFFKKNLRDIATVVGFAIGGPAGAAIGQGVGSVGEGRSLSKSLTSAAKVYGGASFAQGAGLQGGGGSISFGAPATTGQGIGGFFQNLGSQASNTLLGTNYGTTPLGLSFKSLTPLQKLGVGGIGAATLAGMGEEQGNAQMPGPAGGQYLTRGLTPATVSDVYGTGNMRGLPSMPGAQGSNVSMDPITMAYLDILRKQEQDYGNLAFPEFSQGQVLGAKEGGIARLADGGVIPQVDLREFGGDINDPNGSGDEDTVPALLADGEFVVTKQAVKGMGNGDHDQGIAMLYAMMNNNENKAQQMGIGRA